MEFPALLLRLRKATAPAHARLDAGFGALDLTLESDLVRFLSGHYLALSELFPAFRRFVEHELGCTCPDYPAMLAHDLAEHGAALPTAAIRVPAEALAPGGAAGLAYVIAGSRLGNAVIRREGYAGRECGRPSRYMEDDAGHGVWKTLVARLRSADEASEGLNADACEAAALATFATFEHALAKVGTALESAAPHG